MNCKGIEKVCCSQRSSPVLWIIGYGNPQRRDDGIGPYVIERLRKRLVGRTGIRLISRHQLEPELMEDLRGADAVILVDASVGRSFLGGWEWSELEPDRGDTHYLSHHMKPSFLLGLMEMAYGSSPTGWLVSIQGDDFGLGEGLTPRARRRAREASDAILRFVGTFSLQHDRELM